LPQLAFRTGAAAIFRFSERLRLLLRFLLSSGCPARQLPCSILCNFHGKTFVSRPRKNRHAGHSLTIFAPGFAAKIHADRGDAANTTCVTKSAIYPLSDAGNLRSWQTAAYL
jgi:hypothetical protein